MALKSLNGFDANSQRVKHVADGTAADDAATVSQLQAMVRGLSWKASVKAASTTNVTLATPGASMDGVTLTSGDRVLLKDQSTGSQNGIYVWTGASATLTRAVDADSASELEQATTSVEQGTINADRVYVQTVDSVTVGTTALVFAIIGGSVTLSAGNGAIGISGLAISLVLDTASGLVVGAGGVKVDTAVVTRKYAIDVPTSNPATINHALSTSDVIVSVRDKSTGEVVLCDVTVTDANNVSLAFAATPTSAQWRVTVLG